MYVCVLSCSVMSDSLRPHGPLSMSPPGSFVHGDSLDKNTGVGCHALFHGIFPNQGWNPGLPPCRQILYIWAQGKPTNTGMDSCYPSWGDLPDQGIKEGSPALQADSLPAELPRKPPFVDIDSLFNLRWTVFDELKWTRPSIFFFQIKLVPSYYYFV